MCKYNVKIVYTNNVVLKWRIKRIIFWNLEKRELNNIESKAKYIIFTDKDVDINRFNIKPIIIRFHGSLIIDYETNETIFLVS